MAPVIWGLPLEEIKWSKFKSSNMWNNKYHLRRTKFITYQLGMIFSIVGESLGTAALSNYLDEQKYAATSADGKVYIYNNDFVGAFSYNIFSGVFVSFIFGAGFFFDLFWPERHEDRGIKLAWKWCAVAACLFQLGAALSTTIILATHNATIKGATEAQSAQILEQWNESPLSYKTNHRGIASVVFTWLGFVFVVVATVVMWKSYAHNDVHGPLAAHVRKDVDVEKRSAEYFTDTAPQIPEPEPAHSAPYQHTQPSALDSMVMNDREAEPYNVATASTLNGTKAVRGQA